MKAKIVGKTHADAARIAYPKAKEPTTVGKQVAKRPRVEKAITEALKDAGVTPLHLAKRIKEGTDATHQDFEGNEHPDFGVRHKYIDTSIKVLGGYAPELHAHAHKHSLTDEMLKDLDDGKI